VPDFGSREFARSHQQGIDLSPVRFHVQFLESIGTLMSEAFGVLKGEAELSVDSAGRL